MFKKNQEENLKKVETIIGQSVKVKGDFNSEGNIIVEGVVSGNLKTAGSLRIGEKAKVIANVSAKEAVVSGEIKGNIKIEGYLELSSTAKILGDITASSISVERGAIIHGNCSMLTNTEDTEKKRASL